MAGKPFDATLKELIEAAPEAWARRLYDGPITRAALIDSELSTVTAAADKVIRVERAEGPFLLNVEPESSDASEAPEQLLMYSAVLNRRHDEPVRSVLLLLRPSAEAAEASGLLEKYHNPPNRRAPGELPYLVFRYEVQRLWTWSVDSLLSGPLPLAALAPVTNEAAADPAGVIARAVRRIEAEPETSVAEKDKLEMALGVLLRLRFTEEAINRMLGEVRTMEGTAFGRFIETQAKALAEERAKVIAEERAKVIAEERAKVIAAREVAEMLLEFAPEKLGQPDAATTATVNAIDDLDRLRRLRGRLLKAASWADLLSTP